MPATKEQEPRILDGTKVQVVDGEHAGRFGVIVGTRFKTQNDSFLAGSGDPSVARFAEVDVYEIRTRDSDRLSFSVTPDQIRQVREALPTITPPEVTDEKDAAHLEHLQERRAIGATPVPEPEAPKSSGKKDKDA